MAPFGVKVHSVITGGVNTAIGDGEDVQEAEKPFRSSVYNVDGGIESGLEAKDMARKGVSPAAYAKDLVPKVLKKLTRFNLYAGKAAYILHIMGRYYPLWLVEWLMQLIFKQRRVFNNIRKSIK